MATRYRHPDLREKLNLLYNLRINPEINRHSDLARSLGVTRQAINKWIHGNYTSPGNSIPAEQLDQLSRLFDIPQYWFAEPLNAFSDNLTTRLRGRTFETDELRRELRTFTSMLPLTDLSAIGRDGDLQCLSDAWHNDDCRLLQIIAFGGVGKSTLINAWLHQTASVGFLGAERIYAWSFHWQGGPRKVRSSADHFLEAALEWFGDADATRGSSWSKAVRLVRQIRQYRTLLILDGLEALQRPPGDEGGEIEDTALALLIRELTSEMQGLCLVSSRIGITGIDSFYGSSVGTLHLGPLEESVGIDLLRRQGIKGANADMREAVLSYRGHALSLKLLAGYLNTVNAGQIEYWVQVRSLLGTASKHYAPNRIMRAYAKWFKGTPELALLQLVSLFDRAVTLKLLQSVIDHDSHHAGAQMVFVLLRDLRDEGWKLAIHKLQTAQLISASWSAQELLLDVHPLVRNYFSERLKFRDSDAWRTGHLAIVETLIRNFDSWQDVSRHQDLLFDAVVHACLAEDYQQALQIYQEKIKQGQVSLFNMGSHHADLNCLRHFFTRPWERTVTGISERASYYLISCAAVNLVSLGRFQEAIGPLQISVDGLIEQKEFLTAIVSTGPLVSMLLYMGSLDEAFALIRRIESLAPQISNRALSAVVDNYIAHAHHMAGNRDTARMLFDRSFPIYLQAQPGEMICFPMVSCFHSLFLTEGGDPEAGLERAELSLEWRRTNGWQTRFDTTTLNAMDHLAMGRALLLLGKISRAQVYLNMQVDMLRAVDDWLFLPFGLNHRSLMHIVRRDYQQAWLDLDESMRIAKQTGALLLLRDAHINMCHLHVEQDDLTTARDWLARARAIPIQAGYGSRESELAELIHRLAM